MDSSPPPGGAAPVTALDGKRALLVGLCVGLVLVGLTVAIDWYIRRRAAPKMVEEASEWLDFQEWKRANRKAVDNGGKQSDIRREREPSADAGGTDDPGEPARREPGPSPGIGSSPVPPDA